VLLTRVPKVGIGAARDARAYITGEQRLSVLATEIEHNRERYAEIWGTVPASRGAYKLLADELLKEAS